MIYANYHLLAILPTLLFVVSTVVQFISKNRLTDAVETDNAKDMIESHFRFTASLEFIVLSAINGAILGELSGSFGAGVAALLAGVFAGVIIMSLLNNGYTHLAEYLFAFLGLLFLYEFIYFLLADSAFSLFGLILIGWQQAAAWFFGLIGFSVLGFILYTLFFSGDEEE